MSFEPPQPPPDDEATRGATALLRSPEVAPFWLAAIIESADDAIISKTLEGVIASWNKGAERIFGYTAEEVVGKPITMLIPKEPSALIRVLSRKANTDSIRLPLRTQSGGA
jgi:PAS domain-containing protein